MLPRRRNGSRPISRDAERLLDLLNTLGGTTFRQLLWQKASPLDLTYAQSQVLFYVDEHPGCHMGDVAKAFSVTLPAVTHIVDRLEEKQFVQRSADVADRQTIYTHPGTSAETRLLTITQRERNRPVTLDEALKRLFDPRGVLLVNGQSGRAAIIS